MVGKDSSAPSLMNMVTAKRVSVTVKRETAETVETFHMLGETPTVKRLKFQYWF